MAKLALFGGQLMLASMTLVLASGCGAVDGICRVLPVVPAGQEAAALPTLGEPCVWMAPSDVADRIPAGLRMLGQPERDGVLVRLGEAERLFFGADPEAGKVAMAELWVTLESRPEYLPTGAGERATAYRVLATWMRVQATESGVGQTVATWLACHMPDQEPSVLNMPAEAEAVAAKAVETSRRAGVLLEAPAPLGCIDVPVLFMDGVEVGRLPLHGVRIPQGTHAFWAECDGRRSWVRIRTLSASIHLPEFDLAREAALSIRAEQIELSAQAHTKLQADLLQSLASWSGASAVAVLGNDDVWVASPDKVFDVVLFPDEPLELAGKLEWNQSLLWAAGGLAATSLALLGGGLGANSKYNELVAQTNVGNRDRRDELGTWRDGAVAMYVSAGVLGLAAATMMVVDLLMAPSEPEPLFD